MSVGFEIIHSSVVVLRQKLFYKQTKAYHRDGVVYAKVGGGFIKLYMNNKTSHPDITIEAIEGVKIVNKKAKHGDMECKL